MESRDVEPGFGLCRPLVAELSHSHRLVDLHQVCSPEAQSSVTRRVCAGVCGVCVCGVCIVTEMQTVSI